VKLENKRVKNNNTEEAPSQQMRLFELITAVAGILALLVAVYFGVRSEHKKVLEIRYTAMLSLLAPGTIAGDKVNITFGNSNITNLSKLSGYIINTGDVPIEMRDIEEPLSLEFTQGSILEAHVTNTIPKGIVAKRQLQTVL